MLDRDSFHRRLVEASWDGIWARDLSGRTPHHDPRPLLWQVRSIQLETARAKHVDLVVDIAPEVPAWLVGDPHRLSQVVSHLASNAVTFTESGHVRINVALRPPGLAGTDGAVVLRTEVVEAGIGITGGLTRLVEPFRQPDAFTTRTFGGTEGPGSTCWFTGRFGAASRHRPRRVAGATPASTRSTTARGHVLVAEDNDVNQLVTLGWLDALGYPADTAETATDVVGVANATTTAYDLIPEGLQVPSTDGVTADPEPGPALLDVDRLTELDEMGERAVALVDRAVQNFVTGFPGTLAAVRQAVAGDDAAEVQALTHKLRGSALTLGAMRVGAVAQELEDLADLGTVAGSELLVDRLAAAGAEACDALVLQRFDQAAAS